MPVGFVRFSREVWEALEGNEKLFYLYGLMAFRAKYQPGVGRRGTRLAVGQLVTSKDEIARLTGWPRTSCERAMKRLVDLGLIGLQAGRKETVVTICHLSECEDAATTQRAETGPAREAVTRAKSGPKTGRERAPTNKEQRRQKPPPPPTPSAEDAATAASWEEVEEALRGSGVSAVREARLAAQDRGLSPGDVLSLAVEFNAKRGAWNPGALFKRVTGELAAWPEPLPGYRDPGSERLRTDRQRLSGIRADLEAQHGSGFRDMPEPQQRDYATRAAEKYPGLNGTYLGVAAMELYAQDLNDSCPCPATAGTT